MREQDPILEKEVVHDQFTDAILKVWGAIRQHSKFLITLSVVIVLAATVIVGYFQRQSANRAEASIRYQKLSDRYQVAETEWLSAENTAENDDSPKPFEKVAGDFKSFFQNPRFAKTPFADRAKYSYAKIQFYQRKIDSALEYYQDLTQNVHSENQLLAVYAHQAIANCHEQKGDYQQAISAYKKLAPLTVDGLSSLWIEHLSKSAQLGMARCYEKLNQPQDLARIYNQLLKEIEDNIQQGVDDKSRELTTQAKELLVSLPDISAEGISGSTPYKVFQAYQEKIHRYKVQKDIEGRLGEQTREKLRTFETQATDFTENLDKAIDHQERGKLTTAWRYYRLAIGVDGYDPDYGRQSIFDFAPNRKVYEAALFHQRRIANN